MTAQNPPVFLQTSADGTPAEDVRRWIATITRDKPGIIGSTDLLVTAGAGMGISVADGRAFVAGSQATYQGTYFVENRAATTLTVAGGHATLPRKDGVYAKVEDAAYSGAVNLWSLVIVAGTPNSTPVLAAAPANSLLLAEILVPAAAAAITSVTITDKRTVAIAPGVPVFTDTAERTRSITTPTAGMLTFITSPGGGLAGRYEFYNATTTTWDRLRPNITVSSSAPSDGENGDVWITVA